MSKSKISWDDIQKNLGKLDKVEGGYSAAHRGTLQLSDEEVFVKIGVDENTKKWANKEIQAYLFLEKHHYPFIPKLIAYSDDKSSFAIEALSSEDGWDWSDKWSEDRLHKTLEAMDLLAQIEPKNNDREHFSDKTISEVDDGWVVLANSKTLQEKLTKKLNNAGYSDIAKLLDFSAMADESASFKFSQDSLVHNDVRADNCAWNPQQNAVRLVDWSWMQLGDRRVDINAMLVHVYNSGINILENYSSRLDSSALDWMAGFWFRSAVTPIWPGGPESLRDFQLLSGLSALKLAKVAEI